MPQNALLIQHPPTPAAQLLLLFHDFGSNPQSMQPLGARLAAEFPNAMVVSVQAPDSAGQSGGFQWFLVRGVTEENRIERITQAMPAFEACVAHWQQVAGVDASATALIGFSQGAIMSLESTKRATPMASRVISLGGRFAQLPETTNDNITVHFLHGKADAVMPYGHAVEAAHHLVALGGDVTAEVLPFIGHEIHPEFIDAVVHKLTTHLPKRLWDEALKASKA